MRKAILEATATLRGPRAVVLLNPNKSAALIWCSFGAEDTEQQRQEQLLRTQKLRERGVMFEQQLARADSVASWLLSGEEIEICLKEDGKRWLLGAGSYGKVRRSLDLALANSGPNDSASQVLSSCTRACQLDLPQPLSQLMTCWLCRCIEAYEVVYR